MLNDVIISFQGVFRTNHVFVVVWNWFILGLMINCFSSVRSGQKIIRIGQSGVIKLTFFLFVSPELSSVRDYVITYSVRSMYVCVCMRMYVVICKIDHCIHIHWCIPMGLGHNDPWVESRMWPQQTWGQRSSRGQWPLVQVFGKKDSVSTYFDVFSNLILQWLQKYVIAKASETRGSRSALFLGRSKRWRVVTGLGWQKPCPTGLEKQKSLS